MSLDDTVSRSSGRGMIAFQFSAFLYRVWCEKNIGYLPNLSQYYPKIFQLPSHTSFDMLLIVVIQMCLIHSAGATWVDPIVWNGIRKLASHEPWKLPCVCHGLAKDTVGSTLLYAWFGKDTRNDLRRVSRVRSAGINRQQDDNNVWGHFPCERWEMERERERGKCCCRCCFHFQLSSCQILLHPPPTPTGLPVLFVIHCGGMKMEMEMDKRSLWNWRPKYGTGIPLSAPRNPQLFHLIWFIFWSLAWLLCFLHSFLFSLAESRSVSGYAPRLTPLVPWV